MKLASTKKGIENFLTGSLLEIRPMRIDKLQGLQLKVATVDEWLSGDIREDVIGAIEQGASKVNDYLIVAISSEGTVRNGAGDTIKMELMDILKGDYVNPHVSIWWYKLDSIDEVADPDKWLKANPNLGKTVSYETYQLDVERAEKAPAARNDILAKRFGLPMATAIMLGDGRDDGDEGKISPDHIRPIWLDDDLYTIHVDLDVAAAKKELQGTNTAANFGENYIIAEAMINTVLYAREDYKGTGTPDLFITPHMLNQMLLARDINGRRIYSSKTELATALNVGSINTAEQFEGKTRTTSDSKKKKLVAIIANLADYSLGATKGGEVTHFTQFDIDFNQEKSLLETRCSGALTRVYSAIAIEEDVTTASSGSEDHTV